MEGRNALIAALVSGALAIAVVAVDLQFGMKVEIQSMDDGEWVTLVDASDPYNYREPGLGCGGQELRLVVHNKGLVTKSIPLSVTYYGFDGHSVTVLDEALVILAPSDIETRSFTIPDEAFETDDNSTGEVPKLGGRTVNVNAYAGEIYLSTCVTQEVSQ